MNPAHLHTIFKSVSLIAALTAVVFAGRFALNTHALPASNATNAINAGDALNFAGSVKGRVFRDADATGLFYVGGEDRLRFNLDNHSPRTFALTLFVNGLKQDDAIDVPPGSTRLVVEAPGGPARLRFVLKSTENSVAESAPESGLLVLNQLPSSDYKIARRAVYIAGLAAFLWLALYVRRFAAASSARFAFSAIFLIAFAGYFWIHDNALIPLTGDEPHYMVLAQSFGQDGDYDVGDDYVSETRQTYYPGELYPHTVEVGDDENESVTARYPGLALLMAPAFAGLQADPYVAAKLIFIICSAALTAFWFQTVRRETSAGFALLATPCAFAGMPFLAYTNQIYPETVGALFLFVIVTRIWREANRDRHSVSRDSVLTALWIAVLPLINLKFNAAALFCGLALLWRLLRGGPGETQRGAPNWRAVIASTGVLLAGAATAAGFAWGMYGDVVKGPYKDHSIVIYDFWSRYLTYWIDADRGLFALNPLIVFFFPGLALLFRRNVGLALLTAALILLTNLSGIFQREESHWLLGYCPAGRYWISVLPLMAWIAARGVYYIWRDANPGLRIAIVVGSALAALIALAQTLAFINFQEAYYLPLKQAFNAARYAANLFSANASANPGAIEWLFASHPFSERGGGPIAAIVWTALLLVPAGALSLRVLRRPARPGQ